MKFVKNVLCAVSALALLVIAGACSVDCGDKGFVPNQNYGSLTVNKGSEQGARVLDVDSITGADVTVFGYEMSPVSKENVTLVSGSGSAKIDQIPVGLNRVVTVEAKENINNVLNRIAGVKMTAVTNISSGENSVTVDWASTAAGNVFAELLALECDVSKISLSDVNGYLPQDVHALLINTKQLAKDIKAGSVKESSAYILEGGIVNISSNVSISSGIRIMVSDPVSEALTAVSTGDNFIENVAPGKWKVYGILDGESVVFCEEVEVTSGNTSVVNLVSIATPKPRLENASGKEITEIISGQTAVYLKARTLDGENEPAGVEIFYTTNGSTPSASSTKYTGPVTVIPGVTLKAISILNGKESEISSWTFKAPSLGDQHPDSGNYSVTTVNTGASCGATISGDTTSFVLYSKNATKVLLEIYDNPYGDALPKYDYWMTKDSNNYWRVTVKGNLKNAIYAYRCWGPNWTFSDSWTRGGSSAGFVSDWDSSGNRFNPNKVLFDPYAKEMTHDKSDPAVLGSKTAEIYTSGAKNRSFDTAAYAPKAYVVTDSSDFGLKPQIAATEARIYEAHVRGLTKHESSSNLTTILSGINGFEGVENVPAEYRGTYKGAAYMAKYLKALGINTIELLPIHEADNDCNPDNKAGGNYWSYMSYGFFAPDRRYAYDKSAGGPTREFKEMVKAFHDAGMEVYLDVVYNHTGEGGPWGGNKTKWENGVEVSNPNFDNYVQCEHTFMRGIDNATYYCVLDNGSYWETSGCGNNLRCDNQIVRTLILDSLKYWINEMGVDGFRFDLAPVLGRVKNGSSWGTFNSKAETLVQIGQLGISNNVEMIAEAWDCSWPSGYNVGKFPAGWGDWNGVYRDVIRKLVGGSGTNETKSDNGTVLYSLDATDAIYGKNGLAGNPTGKFGISVNMIDAHDGFTLADLSSYTGKGNALNGSLAWPFGPSDGGNGDDNSVPGNDQSDRRRTARNYIALQMFTRGIPMIVWGDEFSRTQNGNNNAYNIDSVATWNNYNMINTKSPHAISTGGSGMYTNKFGTFGNSIKRNGNFIFMQRMLKMHSDPAFTQLSESAAKTTWIDGGSSNYFGFITDGSSLGGHKFAMLTNQTGSEKSLTIPAPASGYKWVRICDTGNWAEQYENSWDPSDTTASGYYTLTSSKAYAVGAYSTVIFEQVKTGGETQVCASPVIFGTTPFTGSTTVTITCGTSGASIYYTTDGTTPSASSKLYSGAFKVTSTTTVKAIAVKSGYTNSSVTSKQFKLDVPTVASPVISGTSPFQESTTVTISCSTSGAVVYYTTDGTIPSSSSKKYTGAFTLTKTSTVKAIGILSGYENSDVVSKTFTLQTVSQKSMVMLQGFTWNSAPRSYSSNWYKWYGTMKNRANDIKNTFSYVWFNPPSKTSSGSSEGYAPTELNDLNSYYGTASELKEVIQAIQPCKAIADVVVNHRAGTASWTGFKNPEWGLNTICRDDECFSDSGSEVCGQSSNGGAYDTGASYGAYRDLDHTNTTVQNGIVEWMNTVLKPAGFVGWRYDYVKGFAGKYVGQYNKGSSAEFSVGEYWPSSGYNSDTRSQWGNEIKNWVNATAQNGGQRSKAFDFTLKGAMNEVFGCTWIGENNQQGTNAGSFNYALLADSNNLCMSTPSDAVTFIDNHDTGSNQGHWELNREYIGVGYALILTHPGVPCVAWSHYFTFAESGSRESTYPYSGLKASQSYIASNMVSGTSNTLRQHIDYLINLRNEIGIEYDSDRTTLKKDSSGYAAKVQGTNGSLVILIGSGYTPDSSYELVYSGKCFKIWTDKSVSNKCKAPVISITDGEATITCGTDGATIKYGFSSSTINKTYSGKVTMSEGQTIYAYALKDGFEDSDVVQKTYTTSGNETFKATSNATWITDDGCVIFAWCWGGGAGSGAWYAGTSDKSGNFTWEAPSDITYFLLARCIRGTTEPNWSASSGTTGCVYNQTSDYAVTSGQTVYAVTWN